MFFPFLVGNLFKSVGVVIGEEKRGRIQYIQVGKIKGSMIG